MIATFGSGVNGYSVMSVAEPEINEVLGLGSMLPNNRTPPISYGYASPMDLFRYRANGVREHARHSGTATAVTANMSSDGGLTSINDFNNCSNNGDYGDWVTHSPTQVQDAFANNTAKPFMIGSSSETRALDGVGYTRASVVPEPGTVSLMAVGMLVVAGVDARRRNRVKLA